MNIRVRTEFASALKQVCSERGLEPEVALQTIKEAILAAYRRDFGLEEGNDYSVEIDEKDGKTRVFSWPEEKEDEKKDVTPPGFGRIAAQVAKQVLMQKIREAEKTVILDEYSKRVGTLVNGLVLRFDGPNVVIDIGKAEGVMPVQEQIKSEKYRLGQRLTFLIKEIRDSIRGREVIVSRSDKGLIEALFRREVPEVSSGAVEIVTVAREAGHRSKVAVNSTQTGVDPVGSCVGQKGVRVQAVINEVNGEKIDVIQYSEDPKRFIAAALSPAEGVEVEIDEDEKIAEISVPEDQLSLAIGSEGQNVRLAAKLSGYKIDIKGGKKDEVSGKKETVKKGQEEKENELVQAGLSARVVNILNKAGVDKVEQLKKMPEKELESIEGLGPKSVKEIAKVLK